MESSQNIMKLMKEDLPKDMKNFKKYLKILLEENIKIMINLKWTLF